MIESFETLKFYRGLRSGNSLTNPFIKRVRRDRQPKDLPIKVHHEADLWFIKRFGIAYRSQAVFLTGSKLIAQNYASTPSNVVRVIPLGDYSYCWSPKRKDLLFYCSENSSISINDYLEASDYQQTFLADAANCGNEVMLFCEQYLAIPVDLIEDAQQTSVSKTILLP